MQRNAGRSLRALLPAVGIFIVFGTLSYAVILPQTRRAMFELSERRSVDLTAVVMRIVAFHHARVESGATTEQAAQERAIEEIRSLRYGRGFRNYFWICTHDPVLLMHPYRPDLEGTFVGGYTDANGTPVFQRMVELVEHAGGGYLQYLWQWHGDETRVIPKRSYVAGFEPWGWIIGTGIYIDEANALIHHLTRTITAVTGISLFAIAVLVAIVALQSVRLLKVTERAHTNLKLEREWHRDLVETMRDGLVVVDEEQRVTYANRAFATMIGTVSDLLRARKFAELVAEESLPMFRAAIEKRRLGADDPYELTLCRADGDRVECLISPRPSFGADGEFLGSFAIVTDITALKDLQERMAESLAQKETMLKEIHHRVKNNLQIVSSMLHLQQETVDDAAAKSALQNSHDRVTALALVHSFLNSEDHLATVAIRDYGEQLVKTLVDVYEARQITVITEWDDIEVDIDQAVSCGLLLTELLTNALKHAFPDGRGTVSVSVRRHSVRNGDRGMRLEVRDDGVGLAATGSGEVSLETGLGMTLIHALTDQLTGTLRIDDTDGTTITVVAPLE